MIQKCRCCKAKKELTEENYKRSTKTETGFNITCISCGEKARKHADLNRSTINKKQRAKEKERRESDCCLVCGKEPIGSSRFCEQHFYKNNAFRHLGSKKLSKVLEDKFNAQGGKCAYTGLPLMLGENASVDHIKSIALFPESKHDPNNVQWVDITVNMMKREMREGSFLQLIRLIYINKSLDAL